MILLAVVCVLLYVLGGMLAWTLIGLHVESEPDGKRSPFRDPAARWAAILFWPSLAFFMMFGD